MNESSISPPFISVIIPVFNGEKILPRLFDSLISLDYPRARLEVLLVDNNSTDRTADLISKSDFTYLSETEKQSSYAARNRGIEEANGDILAFTDADCWVDPAWLRRAFDCMEKDGADLVAGEAEWVVTDPGNIYEIYSKDQFGRQEEFVREGFCMTANVLIRRRVFENMGPFDARMVSSGDRVFSSLAVEKGFRLVYCPDSKVYHEARKIFTAMRRKWWRVGFGYGQETFYYGRGEYFFSQWRWYVPGLRRFREISSRHKLSPIQKIKLFFLDWLCKVAYARGNRAGYVYSRDRKILASKDQ